MTTKPSADSPPLPVRVAEMHILLQAVVARAAEWLECPVRWGVPLHKESHEPQGILSAVFTLRGRSAGITVVGMEREAAEFLAHAIDGRWERELPDLALPVAAFAQTVATEAESGLAELGTRIGRVDVVVGKSRCLPFPPRVRPLCVPLTTDRGTMAVEFGLLEGSTPAGDCAAAVDRNAHARDEIVLH